MGSGAASSLRVLVYGAGVLGSLYAARLWQAGHDVALLARGRRLADLQEQGIVLEHAFSGKREVVRLPLVVRLDPSTEYDLIVVLVRWDQVDSVLPDLASYRLPATILFMVNNPSGYGTWLDAVGPERLLLGFAGAGGTRVGPVVRYTVVSRLLQPTTLGEVDGRLTPRLRTLAREFRAAGFPTALTRNMNAWQKTHVAWVSPLANAIYMAGGDQRALAGSPYPAQLTVRAVREGFQVLARLGVPVTPPQMRVWQWVPEPVLVATLRRWALTRHFRTVALEHTLAAADEMRELSAGFKALAKTAEVETPALDELRSFIPPLAGNGGNT